MRRLWRLPIWAWVLIAAVLVFGGIGSYWNSGSTSVAKKPKPSSDQIVALVVDGTTFVDAMTAFEPHIADCTGMSGSNLKGCADALRVLGDIVTPIAARTSDLANSLTPSACQSGINQLAQAFTTISSGARAVQAAAESGDTTAIIVSMVTYQRAISTISLSGVTDGICG